MGTHGLRNHVHICSFDPCISVHARNYLPVTFSVISVLFWFLPQSFRVQIPIEVSPSIGVSRSHCKKQRLQTGRLCLEQVQGTYAMDYAKYHSRSINETDFGIRFDRASSFFLTLTNGRISRSWTVFTFLVFLFAMRLPFMVKHKKETEWIFFFQVFVPWFALSAAIFLFHLTVR
jgi:hypothetical protein